ncbi:TonB-dependent receptor [Neolewinella antarctica]|uniref:TonB-dependent receptor n=1 Tax=Neolewinella antarctica TaxID=442734 RepID=A0ABX0XES6_9BACT|nr:TonB-dependent receptor [Neolewinella antarctica]NJC27389.1 hypothetical protein [Neolewinella antarctica]
MLWTTFLCGQQDGSRVLAGKVISADSYEPIIGATIFSGQRGTQTNEDGLFSIRVGPDDYLIVSAFSFRPDTIPVNTIDFGDPKPITLQAYTFSAVTVRARRPRSAVRTISPEIAELRELPSLLGEQDLLRNLSYYPGVANGVEGTTGLHVRGGESDHSLLLLDGGTIYNSAHALGFLSVFNQNTVSSVDLYKSYIPPTFSGRLGGVLDVATRTGNKVKSSGELSLGLINSSLLLEGPIGKDTTLSYLLGARGAYTAPLTLATSLFSGGGPRINVGLYDVNFSLHKSLSNLGDLSLRIFQGNDFYLVSAEDDDLQGSYRLSWGNSVVNLQYALPLRNNMLSKTTLVRTRYANRSLISSSFTDQEEQSLSTVASITETQLKQSLVAALNRHSLTWTGTMLRRRLAPADVEFDDQPTANFDSYVLSTSMEDQFSYGGFDVALGVNLRRSWQPNPRFNFTSIEPRAGISRTMGEMGRLYFSYTRMFQRLHRVTAFAGTLPYDLWLPSFASIPPQASHNFSLDYSRQAATINFEAGLFYRTFTGQVVPGINNFNLSGDAGLNTNLLAANGTGNSYGVELLFEREIEDGKFSFAYTYSRSFRRFPEINDNRRFPFRFDRPHDLSLTYRQELSDKWSVSGGFVLQSGINYSLPTAFIISPNGDPAPVFTDRNNARLPTYHRLDLMFSKFGTTKRGYRKRLDLGFYNVYARANPSFAIVRQSFIRETFAGPDVARSLFLLGGAVFRIIPTVNYSVQW